MDQGDRLFDHMEVGMYICKQTPLLLEAKKNLGIWMCAKLHFITPSALGSSSPGIGGGGGGGAIVLAAGAVELDDDGALAPARSSARAAIGSRL